MAAKIVKTEKLLRPACRLTGLRYTEADRKNGSFSHKWAEWFSQGLFAPLEQAPLFWIYGSESSGEIYGMSAEALCQAELDRRGWVRKDAGWHFERYNCPRFTTPDAQGNVILDYGVPLASGK